LWSYLAPKFVKNHFGPPCKFSKYQMGKWALYAYFALLHAYK
jgi:hypothetical protein